MLPLYNNELPGDLEKVVLFFPNLKSRRSFVLRDPWTNWPGFWK